MLQLRAAVRATIVLQSLWRRRQAILQLRALRAAVRATVVLQSLWRCRQTMRRLQACRRAAAAVRAWDARRLHCAKAVIQRFARGMLVRRQAAHEHDKREVLAAYAARSEGGGCVEGRCALLSYAVGPSTVPRHKRGTRYLATCLFPYCVVLVFADPDEPCRRFGWDTSSLSIVLLLQVLFVHSRHRGASTMPPLAGTLLSGQDSHKPIPLVPPSSLPSMSPCFPAYSLLSVGLVGATLLRVVWGHLNTN